LKGEDVEDVEEEEEEEEREEGGRDISKRPFPVSRQKEGEIEEKTFRESRAKNYVGLRFYDKCNERHLTVVISGRGSSYRLRI